MSLEFRAEVPQVIVPPHSLTPPPDVLAEPRLTVVTESQESKLWNSCISKGHSPSGWVCWARSQRCTQTIASVQLWGQETQHCHISPLWHTQLPFITQHQPLPAEPLLCTHTQKSLLSVPMTVSSPGSTVSFSYLQHSVAPCCYTDAILSKHGFNTTVGLAWKSSTSCASKPVNNWCN